MPKEKRIVFRIDEDLYDKFKDLCEKSDKNVSKSILGYKNGSLIGTIFIMQISLIHCEYKLRHFIFNITMAHLHIIKYLGVS